MKEHQVIIVGAGPAGSACAKALKEEEVDVLVIEKEKLPRHKTCSGVLFGQTQVLLEKYFGQVPPKSVYCEPKIIKASDIIGWNQEKGFKVYPFELPKDGLSFPTDYCNIWRNKFDHITNSHAIFHLYFDELRLLPVVTHNTGKRILGILRISPFIILSTFFRQGNKKARNQPSTRSYIHILEYLRIKRLSFHHGIDGLTISPANVGEIIDRFCSSFDF